MLFEILFVEIKIHVPNLISIEKVLLNINLQGDLVATFQEVHLRHNLQERRKAGGAEMQPGLVLASERGDLYK